MKSDVDIILEAYNPEYMEDLHPAATRTLKDIVNFAINLLNRKKDLSETDYYIFRIFPDEKKEINFEIEVGEDNELMPYWTEELADKKYSFSDYLEACKQIREIIK